VEPSSLASPLAQPPTRLRTIARRIASILWTVLILATLYVCYFTHLSIIGFVGPDEPRYASIARAMSETGDWITPRLDGKPWFEKPPLYYWSAATSFKLFGISERSARLPSAIFALLATLAIAWLAWRFYGAETSRWVLLLLPTSIGMIGFSHAASTDMPFAATLTLAMLPAAYLLGLTPRSQTQPADSLPPTSVASPPATSSFAAIFLGFLLGLAVLAKGPAALILCGGGVALWAVFTRRWRDTLRLLHPAAISAFCLSALPWYILCAYRNPKFFRVFIIEHNFKRFLTPEFQHLQPFWFYGEILLVAFLPWTAALLWAAIAGIRRMRSATLSSPTIFLLCWATFCVAFFSISRSKLPGYILPAVPPIALLLARACTNLSNSTFSRRVLAFSCLAFATIDGTAFSVMAGHSDHLLRRSVAFWPVAVVALVLVAASNLFFGILMLLGRRSVAVIVGVLPFFVAFWMFGVIDQFTPLSVLSARYVADQIAAEQVPLSMVRAAQLKRDMLYGLNFYLHSDLREWDHDPRNEVYVVTDQLRCSRMREEMKCEDLWVEQERVDNFTVLHLSPKP
jgi:4-amino-4-deoxy-L-arabinose transferase-like glycosyltransferase